MGRCVSANQPRVGLLLPGRPFSMGNTRSDTSSHTELLSLAPGLPKGSRKAACLFKLFPPFTEHIWVVCSSSQLNMCEPRRVP